MFNRFKIFLPILVKIKVLDRLDKQSLLSHKLQYICNWNCIKVSYNCMRNMAAIIKLRTGNSNAAHPPKTNEPKLAENCNCRKKPYCPLNGNCPKTCLVFKATISHLETNGTTITDCSQTAFKKRFNNHSSSFRHKLFCWRKVPNYQNEFGSTKTKATITKSNGVSLKKLLHIAVVQKYAAFVRQKSCKSPKRNQKYCLTNGAPS